MEVDFKDYLTYVRIFIGIFTIKMFISTIPTLKQWSWGFWSYEYLATITFLIIYIWLDNSIITDRKLYKIEDKLNTILEKNN